MDTKKKKKGMDNNITGRLWMTQVILETSVGDEQGLFVDSDTFELHPIKNLAVLRKHNETVKTKKTKKTKKN